MNHDPDDYPIAFWGAPVMAMKMEENNPRSSGIGIYGIPPTSPS